MGFCSLHVFFPDIERENFDDAGFQRVKDILIAVVIPDGEMIDRRFVEIVWFMPTYMHWQRWHFVDYKIDTDKLDDAINYFEQRITTILGLP